jgi:hypothetical protein
MNSFTSLKQIEKCRVEVAEKLEAVPILRGAAVVASPDGAVEVDPPAGRLLLAPGAYFVALTSHLAWRFAERITLAVIVGQDERFRGPRVTAEGEPGALELFEPLRRAAIYCDTVRPEWDRRFARTVSTFGVVNIPPGPVVPLEVWANALVQADDPVGVTFTNGELIVIQISPKG